MQLKTLPVQVAVVVVKASGFNVTKYLTYLIVVCMVGLSGCAMPVPFQIASWVTDSVVILHTKKSVADHGISIVVQKDCSLWRGVIGDTICTSN